MGSLEYKIKSPKWNSKINSNFIPEIVSCKISSEYNWSDETYKEITPIKCKRIKHALLSGGSVFPEAYELSEGNKTYRNRGRGLRPCDLPEVFSEEQLRRTQIPSYSSWHRRRFKNTEEKVWAADGGVASDQRGKEPVWWVRPGVGNGACVPWPERFWTITDLFTEYGKCQKEKGERLGVNDEAISSSEYEVIHF